MTAHPAFAIRPARAADLDALAGLFDAYRGFYEQPPDRPRARAFLAERMSRGESVLLVAEAAAGGLAGFCQLYPTFCSVAAAPIFVLYDLFVAEAARRGGAARALTQAAADHARAAGAVRLELSTARDNHRAQSLYESLGWQRDERFLHYALPL